MTNVTILHGDCRDQLKNLPDNSVDSIVTDPPYELGFMGKSWDASGIAYNVDMWQEALRVLKPGGHMLAFSGGRTYHRMTVAIEDAGFEIRDQIMWVYGQGFPKNHNVSKAISQQTGICLCTCPVPEPNKMINKLGDNNGQETYINRRNEIPTGDDDRFSIGDELGGEGSNGNEVASQTQHTNIQNKIGTKGNQLFSLWDDSNEKNEGVSSVEKSILLKGLCEPIPENTRFGNTSLWSGLEENTTRSSESGYSVSSMQTEIGQGVGSSSLDSVSLRWEEHDGQSGMSMSQLSQHSREENGKDTINNTNEDRIKKWNIDSKYICPKCNNIRADIGGTALKPAHEPICVARKPLEGTIAQNVLKHGTGALNIDASRVPIDSTVDDPRLGGVGSWKTVKMAQNVYEGGYAGDEIQSSPLGRWPANFIHDGSDEVVKLFPNSKGQQANVKGNEPSHTGDENSVAYGEYNRVPFTKRVELDTLAARFFYCAKASPKDRNAGLDDFEGGKTNDGRKVDADNAYQRGASVRKNTHPTVKPTELMRYLVKMVTPPGGTTLDPFMGSGSTGRGAMLGGFNFIGIEMTDEYIPIATARIEDAKQEYEQEHNAPFNQLFEVDDE